MKVVIEEGQPDGILISFENLYVETYEEAFTLLTTVNAVLKKQRTVDIKKQAEIFIQMTKNSEKQHGKK